jgi:uncharacterized protein YdiU (UPF0061 family)
MKPRINIPFDNSFARLPEAFYARQSPEKVPKSELLILNESLANDLNIKMEPSDISDFFSGNRIPDGADPLSQAYSGHQFGNWAGRLGDGRAILLGEVIDRAGQRQDIQLKGAGRTMFSRGGDGRAWLGPVLREYVVSEAMHALGVPTTRALAAVATGAPVLREHGPLPGAVLTRVAKSHIRVGTFQYFASTGDNSNLQVLFEHTVARHYPHVSTPIELLRAVLQAQSELVAKWMGVGFIHGVMNTDNCHIAGQTIDYGPCAFMDDFHGMKVFSSIDQTGRYAYSNQPNMAAWNCAQLATALLNLEPNRDTAIAAFQDEIGTFGEMFMAEYLKVFGAKLGLATPSSEDAALIETVLSAMQSEAADFTNTFRALTDDSFDTRPEWHAEWANRVTREPDARGVMAAANPVIIPRNHQIENMIASAVNGDLVPMNYLNTALQTPFDPQSDDTLRRAPAPDEKVTATFCGT